jgi:hypothetical protein
MQVAAVLFAIAAAGGIVLATFHFRGRNRPLPLAMIHMLVAAAGLVMLGRAVFADSSIMLANVALGIIVVVALGGLGLLSFRLRAMPLPSALVAIHGLAAVVGIACLLAAIFMPAG